MPPTSHSSAQTHLLCTGCQSFEPAYCLGTSPTTKTYDSAQAHLLWQPESAYCLGTSPTTNTYDSALLCQPESPYCLGTSPATKTYDSAQTHLLCPPESLNGFGQPLGIDGKTPIADKLLTHLLCSKCVKYGSGMHPTSHGSVAGPWLPPVTGLFPEASKADAFYLVHTSSDRVANAAPDYEWEPKANNWTSGASKVLNAVYTIKGEFDTPGENLPNTSIAPWLIRLEALLRGRPSGWNVSFPPHSMSSDYIQWVSCSKRRSSANGKEKDISTHFSPRPSWRARFKPTHLGAFSRLKNKWLFSYFPVFMGTCTIAPRAEQGENPNRRHAGKVPAAVLSVIREGEDLSRGRWT